MIYLIEKDDLSQLRGIVYFKKNNYFCCFENQITGIFYKYTDFINLTYYYKGLIKDYIYPFFEIS